MTYYHALGAVSQSDWCSDRNPQSACRGGPNICSPRIPRTLDLFRRVQEGVNKVARARGFSTISVDGDIGPETVAGVSRALGRSISRCEDVARKADSIVTALASAARSAGAGVTPDQTDPMPREIDPDDPGSLESAREAMNLAPRRSSILAVATNPWVLAGLGVAALGLWYFNSRPDSKAQSAGWWI